MKPTCTAAGRRKMATHYLPTRAQIRFFAKPEAQTDSYWSMPSAQPTAPSHRKVCFFMQTHTTASQPSRSAGEGTPPQKVCLPTAALRAGTAAEAEPVPVSGGIRLKVVISKMWAPEVQEAIAQRAGAPPGVVCRMNKKFPAHILLHFEVFQYYYTIV